MSAGPQCETGQPARMAAATPSRSGNLSMPGEPLRARPRQLFEQRDYWSEHCSGTALQPIDEKPRRRGRVILQHELFDEPASRPHKGRSRPCLYTHFGEAPDRWVVEHNAIFSPAVERAGREESGFRRGSWATLSLAMWSAAISFLQRRRPIQSEDVEEEVDEIQIEHQGARDGKRHG